MRKSIKPFVSAAVCVMWVFLSQGCGPRQSAATSVEPDAEFLYVWTASADTTRRAAFLSVFDLRPQSPKAGQLVRTVWAGAGSSGVHHTEYAVPRDNHLFANDFGTGQTYVFDLSKPGDPAIAASFGTAGPFGWPHSYAMLPNGNRLTTYQWQSTKFDTPPGGIAEVTPAGKVVRWVKASSPDAPDNEVTPYSLEVVPSIDRAVTTSTSMIEDTGVHIQIWRLSDLTLLNTLKIPAGEHMVHGSDTIQHHRLPGEPRLLEDGKTVMFATFMCGLFTLTGIDSAIPKLSQVMTFPGKDCAVPVVIGKYWVQTVPEVHSVVSIDISNPASPREVSRVTYADPVRPHWLARDEAGRRLVMNSGSRKDPTMYLLNFDPVSGKISKDDRFKSLSVAKVNVAGIGEVPGVPHGAVFSR